MIVKVLLAKEIMQAAMIFWTGAWKYCGIVAHFFV